VINCPNPSCKAANPEGYESCRVCQAALPYRYLWGVGNWPATLKPGDLVNQRYLLKSTAENRIFLDTQPGLVPESLPELPEFLLPYLHLSVYPVSVPRPYALIKGPDKDYLLLLESAAFSVSKREGLPGVPSLLPRLSEQWDETSPLRQLSWLWQMAQLWDAFQAEQVAATLLNDDFVRVDGSVLRLLDLASSPVGRSRIPQQTRQPGQPAQTMSGGGASAGPIAQPTLTDLARSWYPLVGRSHQTIRAFLDRLCERLERQQINAEQLSEYLSQAMSMCAQDQAVSYDLAVFTDQGPTRKRNEDACYPASGTMKTLTSEEVKVQPQLLIVCDGIGGHQGGDVASKLAITTIESRLQPLLSHAHSDLTSTELVLAIEAAICAANDEISAQNDQAQRQARDRMGTTLVLALIKGANVYIAHVGDSRAYRVSVGNCQQVTLDDDVASRQVRLGGSLYREVLLQPGSGSLIQALGMSSSQTLRPTVQRFAIAEDCVFLLCSDGLSDSDRVEQFWHQVIRPLAAEEKSTAKVGKQLIELANKYNGHDNVTVGLLKAAVVRDANRMLPRELAGELVSGSAGQPGTFANLANAGAGNTSGPSARGADRGTTRLMPLNPTVSQSGNQRANVGDEPVSSSQPSSQPSSQRGRSVTAGHRQSTAVISSNSQQSQTAANLSKIAAVLALLIALGGALYFLLGGSLGGLFGGRLGLEPETLDRSEESNVDSTSSGNDGARVGDRGAIAVPADIKVGNYVRIRQSDVPGIVSSSPDGTTPKNVEVLSLRLYPQPSNAAREIPGLIPAGGIVQVLEQQVTTNQTRWVRLKLCSIPSGESLADVPAETDSPTSSGPAASGSASGSGSEPNSPASAQLSETMMLSPAAEGWALETTVASVAENLDGNLQPSQRGVCGS